ncbi:amino acid ABC transporter permease [Serratia marcescens]|uniref:amino acid ABC transporter permease n=1 Tax=Serratia marcescens TaxID=615 RepID=UPI00237EFA74|nr:amino acid ABC transporter permease [Serratia marcescens]
MLTFTDWDIVRNLLLAARWTLLLSLTAFFGGTLVALPLALTLFTSAFLVDIWSGSIAALPKGQWEAARCLGLSFAQTLMRVITPQAVRIAIAPTVGFSVQVIKGTALASIIGFVELTKAGTMLNNVTYQPFKVFGLVALGYFLMCYPLSRYSHYLEKKCHADHHH